MLHHLHLSRAEKNIVLYIVHKTYIQNADIHHRWRLPVHGISQNFSGKLDVTSVCFLHISPLLGTLLYSPCSARHNIFNDSPCTEPAYLQNIGGGFFQGGADKQMFWRLCSVFVRGLEAGGPISAYLSYISALLC
jgi:hypothetical protein